MNAADPTAGVATVDHPPARGWVAFTTTLMLTVFFQAVTR